jgi:hypothetical protein
MPHVRQTKGISKEIWNLPHLFSESGFTGQAARRNQIQLVSLLAFGKAFHAF